jgi:hypothetical protein
MDGLMTVDIDQMASGPRGRRFLNAVVALGDTILFRTARGRLAARIPTDKFKAALDRWPVTLTPSFDGLDELAPAVVDYASTDARGDE